MVDRFARLLFGLGVLTLILLLGIYLGWRKLPPAPQLDAATEAARDLRQHWRTYAGVEPTKFLRPARGPGAGVTVNDERAAQPGVTVMSGLWGDEVGLSLRAMDGTELHRWRVRASELRPLVPPELAAETPTHDWDNYLDAWVLYPNGDVIVNFGGLNLVRLDRCSRVVWSLPYRTHHSLVPDEEGMIWASGRKRLMHEAPSDRFPGLTPPFREETVVRLDPADGRVLREISLLDVIYRSGAETALFPAGTGPGRAETDDPLHLNHVEALTPALAPSFPQFAAGDLLVSLREPSLVMVVDGKTETIKWMRAGPWFGQHDPRFLPNGRISLFDNRDVLNADHARRGLPPRASRILSLDPAAGDVEVLFEGTLARPFFTDAIGKHQYQPNGNVLITESWGGRALEVTPDDRIVWEFVNRFDEGRVALVPWALRYPAAMADFPKDCPAEVGTAALGGQGRLIPFKGHMADSADALANPVCGF